MIDMYRLDYTRAQRADDQLRMRRAAQVREARQARAMRSGQDARARRPAGARRAVGRSLIRLGERIAADPALRPARSP